ncbi:MAG: tetratricopeptide repeat protein [Bacteroidales bacterium]|nr:tetratricopeptide repeat protein [Bacteroidales bacterium]MCF8389466.1 tetratricopeptide repeat protein [Bacteroidales bacterium]
MDKNNHLISKYLEGELNPVQTRDFEEALIQDYELQEELDLRREVDEALADTEVLDLRAQLNEIHEELRPQLVKRSRQASKRVVRYAVAASLAVIISLGTYTLFFKAVNNNKIVSQFYKPYDVTLVNRSANTELSDNIRDALYMYENHQYKEAIGLFEQILETNPQMIASHFYSGVAYMEIEEYNNAGISFNKVLSHNDNLYMEQAEWYLGMVFLATNQEEKARNQFQKIKNENGHYSKEAAKILRKLKRNK